MSERPSRSMAHAITTSKFGLSGDMRG